MGWQAKAAPTARADELSAANVASAMRKACDYELGLSMSPGNNDWQQSVFYAGVLAAYDVTQEQTYLTAVRNWADAAKWTPSPQNPSNADNQCCVQTYAELAIVSRDFSELGPAEQDYAKQMSGAETGRQQWWWCDSLFMAPPALVRMSAGLCDPKYNAFMTKLYWDTVDFLYDKNEHLFYRDEHFFAKRTTNGDKVFWSRGNGWVLAGIARILEYLPESDPNRPRFVALLQEMATRIAPLQGADGLWRSSLLDPAEFPMPETSGTAMFCYAMASGIDRHILDRKTYLPVVRRAWTGLVGEMDSSGRLGYAQPAGDRPAASAPDHTEDYAVGAFLLAGREMVRLAGTRPS